MITVATENKLFEQQKLTIQSKGVEYYLLDVENNNVTDECNGLLEGYEDIYVFDKLKEPMALQAYTTVELIRVNKQEEFRKTNDVIISEQSTFTFAVILNQDINVVDYMNTVQQITEEAKSEKVCIINMKTLFLCRSSEKVCDITLAHNRRRSVMHEQAQIINVLKELTSELQPISKNIIMFKGKILLLLQEASSDIYESPMDSVTTVEYLNIAKRVIDSCNTQIIENSSLEDYSMFAKHNTVSAIKKAKEIIDTEARNLESMFLNIARSQGVYQSVSKQLLLLESQEPSLDEFKEVYDSIHMFPEIRLISVSYPDLVLETNILTARDKRYNSIHIVGRYRVTINVSNGGMSFYNYWGTMYEAQGLHIFSNGSPCLGNMSSELPALIKKGDLENSIAYILSFITTANVDDVYGNRIAGYPLYPYQNKNDINISELQKKIRALGNDRTREPKGLFAMLTTNYLQTMLENKENITPLNVVWGEHL